MAFLGDGELKQALAWMFGGPAGGAAYEYVSAHPDPVATQSGARGGSAHSPAFEAAMVQLDQAAGAARRGDNASAIKSLNFARTQMNDMTPTERNLFTGPLASAAAEVYRPKTQTEIATHKAALDSRMKTQIDAVLKENQRLTPPGAPRPVDPGGEWYRPSAWGIDTSGVAAVTGQMNFLVKAALVGGGLYVAAKLVGAWGRR